MPRSRIDIPETIHYLSILDEHGVLDTELEPQIDDKTLIALYSAMLLGRRFDERMLDLQRQGRIGTFPPIKGQEAAQIGSIFQLKSTDWFVPAFRETAAEIWRGRSLESILLYYNGFNEGTIIPADQRDLPMAVPVGSQILHATGLGYAARYRGTDEIVMTYFGDGATSEGDFHEGLNCAAVYQAPVIFICQNNQWAISIPLKQQTHSATIAQKALAYGMPGIQVDGNDVLAVYTAAQEAAERARNGDGPTLIECVTYRVMMHTTADDPSRYRDDEEVERWRQKDPLTRFAVYLQNKGLLDQSREQEIETEVLAKIQTAVDSAEKQMKTLGEPLDMFNHLYAKMPPSLQCQKEEVRQYLANNTGEVHHG
ncbi:pyruvate dehydrogenase (acetyl-transferring) E1 component subunit alpha [Desulfopila aestuarii]|uniref:Pyruvate dehydrogenase E1 component subunit alpha n=1 Tax=Desulfopila aestuarii DSM 18488 TaxID=1121416 RepID=A0A1M7Y5W8_9BACT|nr:pyruvate dehydrogenase (acetyl-transferring) E1 component subunit alpha [Desulfopila aestuarii]SHO47752.1 pyruvate dehydrogenase E1 component alpha subunit [Desulfopila aestuarii DSM 18488]